MLHSANLAVPRSSLTVKAHLLHPFIVGFRHVLRMTDCHFFAPLYNQYRIVSPVGEPYFLRASNHIFKVDPVLVSFY